MIKIKGLKESEIIDICQKVASNHRNKQFDCFTSEDIEQQVWVIILHKISEFDSSRMKSKNLTQGLENWLNNLVSKRLKNFYRDNYSVKQKERKSDQSDYDLQKRKSLLNPTDIKAIGETSVIHNLEDFVHEEDLWNKLVKLLDDESLDILESLLSGEKINCYYKTKLQDEIEELWEQLHL